MDTEADGAGELRDLESDVAEMVNSFLSRRVQAIGMIAENPESTANEIAEAIGASRQYMYRVLRDLEERNAVERTRKPGDRRAYWTLVKDPDSPEGGTRTSYLIANAERHDEGIAEINDAVCELGAMETSEADRQLAAMAVFWLEQVRGDIEDPVEGHELIVLRERALKSTDSLAEFARVTSSAVGAHAAVVSAATVSGAVAGVVGAAATVVLKHVGVETS